MKIKYSCGLWSIVIVSCQVFIIFYCVGNAQDVWLGTDTFYLKMGTLDLRDKQVKDGSNVNIFIWILILMSVCII